MSVDNKMNTDNLIEAIEKFGEFVKNDLLPEASNVDHLPYELDKICLEYLWHNSRKAVCKKALETIYGAIEKLHTDICIVDGKHQDRLALLEERHKGADEQQQDDNSEEEDDLYD